MGTRGVIAEMHEPGVWRGRYHHWDSYPTALGKTLFETYRGHFKRDLDAMLKVLLHDHKAGWSTINKDWSKPIGYEERTGKFDPDAPPGGPECYCHGSRAEDGDEWINPQDDAGVEWAYVLSKGGKDGPIMAVLKHQWASDGKPYVGYGFLKAKEPLAWGLVKVVKLNGRAPSWDKIEKKVYADA